MFRLAFVALAMAMLGACASMAPSQTALASNAPKSFDDAGAAPAEAPVDVLAQAHPQAVLAFASPAPNRRIFSPPTRRQPDLHPIMATQIDRMRRYARRRRRALIHARASRRAFSAGP